MTYKETLDWLFARTTVYERDGTAAYKPGLETIGCLCEWLGNPQKKLRCVHVAGTNGKGSTSSLIAAIMQSGGLRTGLYTSPHLVDFRERIRVDGEMISEAEVIDFVERWRSSGLALHPSFFELTTAMAFEWFAKRGVDLAVIEVGLGGRLDSTNIIAPMVSIITNISLDHTALLGTTEAEIAAEKAGIIKPGVPVVVGYAPRPDVRAEFELRSDNVIYAPEIKAIEQPDGTWRFPDYGIHCSLRGAFQPQNASTVLTALQFLPEVTSDAIAAGFEHVETLTGLRGRLTVLENEPIRVVYDTGHNPGAWEYLGRELERMPRPLTVVCGFAADKDVDLILKKMPADAHYIFCKPSSPRGMAAEELWGRASGLVGEIVSDVKEAFRRAKKITPDGGSIFIGGSNFVIADLLI